MISSTPPVRSPLASLLRGARATLPICALALGLVVACRSPRKSPEAGVASEAPPAPVSQASPGSNTASDAGVTASSLARSIECMGGERRLSYTRRSEASDRIHVTLAFSAAGHRSWSYRFHYRNGDLQQVEHRVASWHFSGGSSGAPNTGVQNTIDTVLERRYRLTGGEAAECVAARASGPHASVESQLSKATVTAIKCSDLQRLRALASRLSLPLDVPEPSVLAAACSRQDPSSGMKL